MTGLYRVKLWHLPVVDRTRRRQRILAWKYLGHDWLAQGSWLWTWNPRSSWPRAGLAGRRPTKAR